MQGTCIIIFNYVTMFFNKLFCRNNIELFNLFKQNEDIKRETSFLNDIKLKNNYIYRVIDNKFNELLDYRLVVLDYKSIYNYDENEYINKQYLDDLSKYCHLNKLLFIIISELNPNEFPEIDYFNKNNLITPYHYKKKFGSIIKLNANKTSIIPIKVSLNKMLIDIMNQYGIDDTELILINNNDVPNSNIKIKTL